MITATTFFNHPNVKGVIEFEEKGGKVLIKGTLKSNKYRNSTHGIHIHEAGDLTDGCLGACGHFNPYGKKHGEFAVDDGLPEDVVGECEMVSVTVHANKVLVYEDEN
jgi:Cu/Zn superoxide dismutase